MFSSPTMQIAESIFTVSVIMCGCLGSIALDNSKKLLSSPRILCKPYWEEQKAHSEKVVPALETHHQLKLLRSSPNSYHPEGAWQHSSKTPGHHCLGIQVSILSLAFEAFSWQREIQLLRGHQDLVKSVPTKRQISFYFLSISETPQKYEKNLLLSHFIKQALLWDISKLSKSNCNFHAVLFAREDTKIRDFRFCYE